MKELIGILVCILSVVLGLYLGVWVMFIGGIIQLIQGVTPVIIASEIAFGIIKIMFSGAVGWLTFIIGIGIGKCILD